MSPALNGGSEIQHFKHNNAIEIRNEITFDFYTGCHISVFTFVVYNILLMFVLSS